MIFIIFTMALLQKICEHKDCKNFLKQNTPDSKCPSHREDRSDFSMILCSCVLGNHHRDSDGYVPRQNSKLWPHAFNCRCEGCYYQALYEVTHPEYEHDTYDDFDELEPGKCRECAYEDNCVLAYS